MADSQRKTANLWGETSTTNQYIDNQGNTGINPNGDVYSLKTFTVSPSTTYTFSWSGFTVGNDNNFPYIRICFYTSNGGTFISRTLVNPNDYLDKYVSFTIPNNCTYIDIRIDSEASTRGQHFDNLMLNTGSTAKPYEPYGWVHSLRKLTTATEAVEDPLYSDGTAITAYTLKGNTVQNGTPTPSNPVEVNGVGVRTGNIFDGVVINAILNDTTGEAVPNDNWRCTDYMAVDDNTVTVGWDSSSNFYQAKVASYDSSKAFISLETMQNYAYSNTFTLPNGTKYIRVSFSVKVSGGDIVRTNIMINEGTAKPYEPYGYKIPISSGGVTTNIYLGSTQTVRQIKKYVMTGNETISNYASDFQRYVITIPTIPSMGTRLTPIICTHYIGIYDGRPAELVPMNAVYTGSATDNSVLIKTDQTTDRSTFIAWLQEQYANGTPVTLWYAISTPETAAVNEPLMKIGTYADTLSNATAIPTTEGANSITVDTTVQPSEFTATWTGWHDASVKEWDGSQWE